MTTTVDHEFGFELRVCAWAERHWPPEGDEERPVIVARQLGTGSRRWDTIVIEVNRDGFEARREFGTAELDSDLLHVVRNAPASWEFYRDALPHPGYPWRYVREAIHRAADRGVVEERKRGNKIEIRRIAPYPDWVDRIVAIENKPDLDASAARALREQMEHDVALSMADEVWVATHRTGDRIQPALLEDLPVEVGILGVRDGDAEVLWHPRTLAVDAPGTDIVERGEVTKWTESAGRFEYVDPAEKLEKRLVIAERAYGRGWRSFVDTMRPDCRFFDLGRAADGFVPTCSAKDREQTAAECRGNCPSFQPEPPTWRQGSWPIEGGPGKAIKRLLASQRERLR